MNPMHAQNHVHHIFKPKTLSIMYVPKPNALFTTYAIVLSPSLYRINVEKILSFYKKKVCTWNHVVHHII